MSLAKDYFLLYHGINNEIDTLDTQIRFDKNLSEVFAILLIVTRKEFDKIILLKSFQDLFLKLTIQIPRNIEELNQTQCLLINAIQTSNSNTSLLNEFFLYLKNEDILSYENYNKLKSLFQNKPKYKEVKITNDFSSKNFSFNEEKSLLEENINVLEKLISNEDLLKEINNSKDYLKENKFSIGITGVMNAGKSSMLNALLGKEVLGTSVIPETANLTVIKYGQEQSAKVYYWNTKEWNNIVQQANKNDAIKDFVDESNTIFKDELSSYIQDISRFDEIKINDLSLYTSASLSKKKCNLIKYVQMQSELTFLSKSIEIVDTPGLDDRVIQREQITKEYINKCDMMLHLMNVAQSATLKDVEFIIDALLYQNVTKLLIVITKADTVSKEQLNEVITYTKSSIEDTLKFQNKDSSLDYILQSIEFITLSSKMALLHKTNQGELALKAGFSLEDTGILKIESYLNENLFGKSSIKSKLIISSSKKQLLSIINKQKEYFLYELELLSKSNEQLENELKSFKDKKALDESALELINNDIRYYKNDSLEYISSLENFLNNEFLQLQDIIKQRVISDVKYTYEKEKVLPLKQRLEVIIQTSVKDGVVDIIRDYKYKLINKFQSVFEQFEFKYKKKTFESYVKKDKMSAKDLLKNDFQNSFLVFNNEQMTSEIIEAVYSSKNDKLQELDTTLQYIIKSEFKVISDDINAKTNSLSKKLLDKFFDILSLPISSVEQMLKNNEKQLNEQIKNIKTNDKNKSDLSIEVHSKIKTLDSIMEDLKI